MDSERTIHPFRRQVGPFKLAVFLMVSLVLPFQSDAPGMTTK